MERKRKSGSNQGPYTVTNLRKMTGSNPNLDLVNITAHTEFGQIISINFQDIERKRNSEGKSDMSRAITLLRMWEK